MAQVMALLILLFTILAALTIYKSRSKIEFVINRIVKWLVPIILRRRRAAEMWEEEEHLLAWMLTQLDLLRKKAPGESVKVLVHDMYKLNRIFLKKVLNIGIEFTHKDLTDELKKHKLSLLLRKAITVFFSELTELTYVQEPHITKEQLMKLIDYSERLAIRLVHEEEKRKGEILKVHRGEAHHHRVQGIPGEELKKVSKTKLHKLIDKSHKLLDMGDHVHATKLYNTIYRQYMHLERREKEKVYHAFTGLYKRMRMKK